MALTWRGEDYYDPLINSKTVKAVSGKTWHIASLSNFSLETFMANLISMTNPSLQILDKTQTGVFSISGFLVKPPVKKIVITNNDINIKLGTVTKFDKENTTLSKRLPVMLCYQIMNYCHFSNLSQIWSNPEASSRCMTYNS